MKRTFWREVFRDTLRELVRVEGKDGLVQAPRLATLAAAIADAADDQRAQREDANRPVTRDERAPSLGEGDGTE